MKSLLFASTFIFLTGCETMKPAVIVEPVITKVPVLVPCKITPVKKPVMPVDGLKKEDDIHTKAKTALAELELREAYEKELEAAILECQ